MASVKRLRKRGANVVVEANGEALFLPGADLWRWKNIFTEKIRAATALAAPANKRPRWGHYGKPLKTTIIADTRTRITKGGGFFYMAVGSKAPHSGYVDQGTGVFAGHAPYLARVIPPYARQTPSLYESTWRPGGSGARVAPVMIKGQRGQGFFDTGLKKGFQAMRMRSFQVPGEGVSGMSSALRTIPYDLEGFLGNTPPDAGFRASLAEWRAWRDRAFNAGQELGRTRGGQRGRRSVALGTRKSRATRPRTKRTAEQDAARREKSKARSQRYRDAQSQAKKAQSAKGRKNQAVQRQQNINAERVRFLNAARKKYGSDIIQTTLRFDGKRWTMQVYVKTSGGLKVPKPIQGREV